MFQLTKEQSEIRKAAREFAEGEFTDVARELDELERVLREELQCTIAYRPLYWFNFSCLPNSPNVGLTDKGIYSSRELAILDTVVGF